MSGSLTVAISNRLVQVGDKRLWMVEAKGFRLGCGALRRAHNNLFTGRSTIAHIVITIPQQLCIRYLCRLDVYDLPPLSYDRGVVSVFDQISVISLGETYISKYLRKVAGFQTNSGRAHSMFRKWL